MTGDTVLTPFCKKLGHILSRRGMLYFGLGIVVVMSMAALLAPWLAPYDPTELHLHSILEPPSAAFPLGTDALGRDVLSRLLYGARVSLWVGFVSVSISIAIGVVLGLLAGYFSGIVDELIMRGVDVMLCFPSFFLILAVIAFLEPSLNTIMVVIGLTSWMGVARLVRAETLSLRERDFVAAARLAGTKSSRIMLMHILPNALTPVLVSATLGIAGAILVESSLSFLGLGISIPHASWGSMLQSAQGYILDRPILAVYPGLLILLTVLSFNILGDVLRSALEPKIVK